jgi:Fur family peroxide stress response transcriptional regulator
MHNERVRSPEQLVERFRSEGLKITPQRQLLFSLLHENAEHPTADALFTSASALMPGISLRTVYQTLSDLTEMGELGQVTFDGGAIRFDPNLTDHHHAVCNECGTIADVSIDHLDVVSISQPTDFSPSSTSVVFHGICAKCASLTSNFDKPTNNQTT